MQRTFQIRIQNELSCKCNAHSGVPQGSVISPTLFAIMINSLFPHSLPVAHYSLYADDGAFWLAARDLATGLRQAQEVLDSLMLWSHQWGLEVSASKTKCMIFTKHRKLATEPLSLNGEPIEYVTRHKFLGMTLDKLMTWKPHITKLAAKVQKDLRLLQIISNYNRGADAVTLRRIYLSLIRTKLDYGDFLYATAAPTNLKKLDRIQYAATRIILGALRCTKVDKLEAEANLMPLSLVRKQHMLAYIGRVLPILEHPSATLLNQSYRERQNEETLQNKS